MQSAPNNTATIIVPCYNEEHRFKADAFLHFLQETEDINILFVNDGSSDNTADVLDLFSKSAPDSRVAVISKKENQGKAEAIRTGFLQNPFSTYFTGYWDADLSTPLSEFSNLIKVFKEKPHIKVVFGSRVLLLGHDIERRPLRFLFGRVFMTAANLIFNFKVYDSQCGAKAFKTDFCAPMWEEPFLTSWLFDIELLCRIKKKYGLKTVRQEIFEFPLEKWIEVGGSKIKITEFFKFPFELLNLWFRYK